MATQSNKTGFRFVPESQGGTFSFREDASEPATFDDKENLTHLNHIGTMHCNTCVGIYFPIDKNRCFFAHIDSRTGHQNPLNYAEPETGARIKDEVIQRLTAEANDEKWDEFDDNFCNIIYACCPAFETPSREDGRSDDHVDELHPTGAFYAVEGMRDFLLWRANNVTAKAAAACREARDICNIEGFPVHAPIAQLRIIDDSLDGLDEAGVGPDYPDVKLYWRAGEAAARAVALENRANTIRKAARKSQGSDRSGRLRGSRPVSDY